MSIGSVIRTDGVVTSPQAVEAYRRANGRAVVLGREEAWRRSSGTESVGIERR